jgi:hypothetical protein
MELLPLLLLLPAAVDPKPSTTPLRPHIVMVLGDDVGTSDVGWHGQPPDATGLAAKTPNLDRLAAQGVKLSSHCEWQSVVRRAQFGTPPDSSITLNLLQTSETGAHPLER